jgi:hypothetical protein
MFATARDASDTEEIMTFLNEAVAASCEGLMVRLCVCFCTMRLIPKLLLMKITQGDDKIVVAV